MIGPSVETEDGIAVHEGDRVFNYYDMEWGKIGSIKSDGWFEFHPEGFDNYTKLLNGARVSTYDPRERKGF